MNLAKLFEMQRKLDAHIEKEHPREPGEDRLAKKILALLVELGELANELPDVFKFWSHKKNNYERALKEYVDCLHFILSIAIELGYKAEDLYVWDEELEGETVDVFIELMYWTSRISSNDKFKRRAAFRTVCYIFFNLGERLGFTWDQVEQAYLEKNKINHHRQEAGY